MKLKDNHIYVGYEDKLVLWLENRDGNQKLEDDEDRFNSIYSNLSSSGRVVPPLAAGRPPTDDFFTEKRA